VRVFSAGLLLCAIGARFLEAQELRPELLELAANKRVRVLAPGLWSKPILGVLAAADSQAISVTVARNGTAVVIPLKAVSEVKVRQGLDRGAGARRGFLAGFAVGGLTFLSAREEVKEADAFGIATAAAALVGFVVFPAVGALVGSIIPPEAWQTTQFEPAPQSLSVDWRFNESDVLRVGTPHARHTGRVVGRSVDTLGIATTGGPLSIAWTDVRSIEAWGGQNRWKGAAVGALAFIGLGIYGESTAPTTSTGERIGAFTGAAVVGAFIGSRLLARKGWQPLPVPAR
jgi:hypothetical protein